MGKKDTKKNKGKKEHNKTSKDGKKDELKALEADLKEFVQHEVKSQVMNANKDMAEKEGKKAITKMEEKGKDEEKGKKEKSEEKAKPSAATALKEADKKEKKEADEVSK